MVTATSLLYSSCERLHAADRCEAIRTAVAGYRRALLLGEWRDDDGSAGRRVGRVAIAAGPDNIALLARIPDYDAARDSLSAVWSVTDPQWGVLDALTFVSPPMRRGELGKRNDGGVLFQRDVLSDSGHRRCLSGGRYTAELYLNGLPAGMASVERKGRVLQAARLGRLNISVCHPEGWRAWRPEGQKDWSTEPVAGFANAAGRPVAFVLSLAMPLDASRDAGSHQAYVLDRALGLLARYGVLPQAPEAAKTRVAGCDKVGADGIAQGTVTARSGIAHIALVLADALDGADACDVVRSVTVMHGLPG
jgi:hypothetical protein